MTEAMTDDTHVTVTSVTISKKDFSQELNVVEDSCNDSVTTIDSAAASSSTVATQCFYYGPETSFSIYKPSVTDPSTGCSDAVWLWSTSSTLPANVQVEYDSLNDLGYISVIDPSVAGTNYGTYTV